MLQSAIIDVGLALAYVFLLTSLLASALNELVAGVLKQRAKALWRGIDELVCSGQLRNALYAHGLIRSLAPPLSGGGLDSMKGPSYIPPRTFALTLVDVLAQRHATLRTAIYTAERVAAEVSAGKRENLADAAKMVRGLAAGLPEKSELGDKLKLLSSALDGAEAASIRAAVAAIRASLPGIDLPSLSVQSISSGAKSYSSELETVLRVLGQQAAGDLNQLRTAIEDWFSQGMDRVSGWYKRWTQYWQFILGLLIAIVLNVDAIRIGTVLWTDIPLRNSVVAEAEEFAKHPPPSLWVMNEGAKSGDFDIAIEADPLAPGWVDVSVELPEKVSKDTEITLKTKDDMLQLQGGLVVRSDTSEAHAQAKIAKPPPIPLSVDASYRDEKSSATKSTHRDLAVVPDPGSRMERTSKLLRDTGLPIGWPEATRRHLELSALPPMILGWLLTAIAASFGAPFWFDTLQRFVNLRAGGPKPDEKKAKDKG